jgi:hypothetical protein
VVVGERQLKWKMEEYVRKISRTGPGKPTKNTKTFFTSSSGLQLVPIDVVSGKLFYLGCVTTVY